MSTHAAHRRPAAGPLSRRLAATGLACVLALLVAGLPAAAPAHHHAPQGPGGDSPSCSLCLWQSHFAAEPALATAPTPPAAVAAAPLPDADRATAPSHTTGAPRAPPFLQA